MPTAETSTKVNNPTSNGASAQSRRSVFLSKVCQKDVVSAIESRGAKEGGEYDNPMSYNKCSRERSRRRFEGTEYRSVRMSTRLLN